MKIKTIDFSSENTEDTASFKKRFVEDVLRLAEGGITESERKWLLENKDKNKKKINPIIKTQGYKKIINYLNELVKDGDFNKKINEIRNKYQINLLENIDNVRKKIDVPEKMRFNVFNDEDAVNLLHIYGLNLEFQDFLENYICFGFLDETLIETSMLVVEDSKMFKLFNCDVDPLEYDVLHKFNDILYPVTIQISAYASKRDILDFVTKMYKTEIKSIQDSHRKDISFGKTKTKNKKIEDRNNFIYENRHLPKKTLMSKVAEKFKDVLDYAHITKIISLEIKKRN